MNSKMIKILAIDDNNDNLVALSAILRIAMPEATMIKATSGDIGIKLAEIEQPDVILLDILMPVMDGYEVCEKLRKLESVKHIPIIMLTAARTEAKNKIKGLNSGADSFLTKPIEELELMAQIKVMLRIKKSRDLLREERDSLDEKVIKRTVDLEHELAKRIESERKLRDFVIDLEFSKRAMLNLMDDLQDEIIERQRAQEQLSNSKLQLRELNTYVQQVREKEKTEISREIHDVVGQALTALKFDLVWIKKSVQNGGEELFQKIEEMKKLIDETTVSVQRISTELRPGLLDDLGLTYALEWQSEQFEQRTGIKCEFKFNPEDINLEEKISVELFRIVQESLTNVARHAQATKVLISLKIVDSEVELLVVDNGVGIDEKNKKDPKSLGLLGISERVYNIGGKVTFSGEKNIGTEVKVVVQLENGGK